jgi:RNA polymerase sigma-70 factor (ECF subfamily)
MSSDPREIRFRRLYEEHYEMLLAYATRRCPDLSEAYDIVADTFLVLWRRLDEAPVDEEIPLWLHGVIRRVVANHHRGRTRRDRLATRFAQIANDAHETEELAATNMHARLVLETLLKLNEQDREILLLAAWERLSTIEIAAVLGCSENAAALRLHRARRRLTKVYRKENERAGDKPSEWPRLRRPPQERQDG